MPNAQPRGENTGDHVTANYIIVRCKTRTGRRMALNPGPACVP
jgi:hypothetical protein